MKLKEYLNENYIKHSKEFLKLLLEANVDVSIKTITHSTPTLVFWISPDGKVIDAKDAHHKNVPNGDRSILADKVHKGYIRGRVAKIGEKLYCVVYGDESPNLSKKQEYLLKRHYPNLISFLVKKKNVEETLATSMNFIDEVGNDII